MKYYTYLELSPKSRKLLVKAFRDLVPDWESYKRSSPDHMTIGYCDDEKCPQEGMEIKVRTKALGYDGKNAAVLVDDGGISNLRNPHITLGVGQGGHGIDSNKLRFDKPFPSMTLSGVVKSVPQQKPKYLDKKEVTAMNREQIARELVKLAKELVGSKGIYNQMSNRELLDLIEEWAMYAPEDFAMDGEWQGTRGARMLDIMKKWRRMPPREQDKHYQRIRRYM